MAGRSTTKESSPSAEGAALMRPSGPLGLPRPSYDGHGLPNVAASLVRALGVRPTDGPPLVPGLTPALDPFHRGPPGGPVVVVVVDGFGWEPFRRWLGETDAARAAAWGPRAHPITTVFPTTTVAALTSISTGTAPSQHGVVAPNLYLPHLDATVDVLRMSRVDSVGREELVTAGWSTSEVSAAPSLFGRGLRGAALSRHAFARTGFNRILYEGAEFVGYATASDLAHGLAELLGRADPPPVTFAYWDELDTVQHLRGPRDSLFFFEADRIAQVLEYAAAQIPRERAGATTVIVTADHGLVPVDPARQVRVDQIPAIAHEMRRPMAGDRRAGFFTARPGRTEALEEALRAHLPAASRVIPMSAAVEAGLFGPAPYHPELAERLGEFLVLPPVPTGLLSAQRRPDSRSPEFLGSHSGLESAELLIPLVSGSLAELAGR